MLHECVIKWPDGWSVSDSFICPVKRWIISKRLVCWMNRWSVNDSSVEWMMNPQWMMCLWNEWLDDQWPIYSPSLLQCVLWQSSLNASTFWFLRPLCVLSCLQYTSVLEICFYIHSRCLINNIEWGKSIAFTELFFLDSWVHSNPPTFIHFIIISCFNDLYLKSQISLPQAKSSHHPLPRLCRKLSFASLLPKGF